MSEKPGYYPVFLMQETILKNRLTVNLTVNLMLDRQKKKEKKKKI